MPIAVPAPADRQQRLRRRPTTSRTSLSRSAAQRTSTSCGPSPVGQRQRAARRTAAATRTRPAPAPSGPYASRSHSTLAVTSSPSTQTCATRTPSSRRSAPPGTKPGVASRSGRKRGANTTLLVTAARRSAPGCVEGREQPLEPVGLGRRVVVEQHGVRRRDLAQGGVVAAGEAEVAVVAQHPHAGVVALEQRERAVGAGVVDDPDVEREGGASARRARSGRGRASARRSS